jgi:hypothetical protein
MNNGVENICRKVSATKSSYYPEIFQILLLEHSLHLAFRKKYLRIYSSLYRRATGWTAGVRFPEGESDSSLLHSVRFWDPLNPVSNEYPGLLPRGKIFHASKLATHLHLESKSRVVKLYPISHVTLCYSV